MEKYFFNLTLRKNAKKCKNYFKKSSRNCKLNELKMRGKLRQRILVTQDLRILQRNAGEREV